MNHYTCHLSDNADGISASVDPSDATGRPLTVGHGSCVSDAVANALGMRSLEFASPQDELETCIAALRGIPVKLALCGRIVHCCGKF